jgi:hypothetical protein
MRKVQLRAFRKSKYKYLNRYATSLPQPTQNLPYVMEREILQTGTRRAIVDIGIPTLIGILFFWAFTGGAKIALPTNLDWILVANGDPVQHYVGWNFFRDAPFFQWPFGRNPAYGETLSSSIVFTDSIPLFAFLFKPFSILLPAQFQYLGLWMLTCMILQAVFAWQLVSRFTLDNWHRVFATGLIVLTPAMLWRFSGHEALIGHWLILAALCIFTADRRKVLSWTVLLCISSLVHAYLCAMVIAIWMTDVIRRLAYKKMTRRQAAIEVIIVIIFLALVMDFAGYFISTSVSAGGFGYFRMNLLTFFDPSPIWSAFYSDPYRNGDYEGFAYLGAGTLLLAVIALVSLAIYRKPIKVNRKVVLPLSILAFFLVVYALSNQVALGSHELFHYRLPGFMRKVSSTFRVSGRFVWPVVYMIEMAVLAILFSQFRYQKRLVSWILFAVLVLQGYDMTKGSAALQARWNLPYSPQLKSGFWNEAAKKYQQIALVYPTEDTQNVGPLMLFASDHHLGINGGSIARIDPNQLTSLQDKLRDTVANSTYRNDTLYIMLRDPLWNEALDKYTGGLKAVIDGYKVIAPGWDRCTAACGATALVQGLPPKYPETIDFSSNGTADGMLKNWSFPEPTGRWTNWNESSIRLYLGKTDAKTFVVTFEFRPYVTEPHPEQAVKVSINGAPVAAWKFTDNAITTQQIRVPEQLVQQGNGAITVHFDLPDAVSPKDLGYGTDDRHLAIFMKNVTIDEAH